MAGSYHHLAGENGGWSLIENMGDAHEAVEQLLWLVFRLDRFGTAEALLDKEFHPIERGERAPDEHFVRVREIMDR